MVAAEVKIVLAVVPAEAKVSVVGKAAVVV